MKAHISFMSVEESPSTISTGNWGCGAFRGDTQLKFLQQWVAASINGRDMVYCTFNDKTMSGLDELVDACISREYKTGDIVGLINEYIEKGYGYEGIFMYILQ